MPAQTLEEFAKSGPWALAFSIMLFVVIKAWREDRQMNVMILTKMEATLNTLGHAVERLAEGLRDRK